MQGGLGKDREERKGERRRRTLEGGWGKGQRLGEGNGKGKVGSLPLLLSPDKILDPPLSVCCWSMCSVVR